jgi:MinD superfamily P-loop ATPase
MFEDVLSVMRDPHDSSAVIEEAHVRERTVVAVASGKGGTGKTTVATNLAVVAAASGRKVQLLDCDVEAPNAHLFLNPEIERSEAVGVPVPEVDEEKCTACGECGRICQYSAIVSLKTNPLVFPELCHGCGGCALVCPEGAITECPREVGILEEGCASGVRFAGGKLRIGEAMAPPLIRAVEERAVHDGLVVIDAPPGTSCPMVESVRSCDFALLVTEPTPFGLNDLAIAVDTVRKLGVPFAVVVNRAGLGHDTVYSYCEDEGIDILAELPDDRRVAEAYSRGELAVRTVREFKRGFETLLGVLGERCAAENATTVDQTG